MWYTVENKEKKLPRVVPLFLFFVLSDGYVYAQLPEKFWGLPLSFSRFLEKANSRTVVAWCWEQHFHVSGLKIFMKWEELAQKKSRTGAAHIQTWMTST